MKTNNFLKKFSQLLFVILLVVICYGLDSMKHVEDAFYKRNRVLISLSTGNVIRPIEVQKIDDFSVSKAKDKILKKHNVVVKPVNKVAIIITGLGLDESLTEKFIGDLPDFITLGFSAYTNFSKDTKLSVKHHDVIVQLPLRPIEDNIQGGSLDITAEMTDDEVESRVKELCPRDMNCKGVYSLYDSNLTRDEYFAKLLFKSLANTRNGNIFLLPDNLSLLNGVLADSNTLLKGHMIFDARSSSDDIFNLLCSLIFDFSKNNHKNIVVILSATYNTFDAVNRLFNADKSKQVLFLPISSIADHIDE